MFAVTAEFEPSLKIICSDWKRDHQKQGGNSAFTLSTGWQTTRTKACTTDVPRSICGSPSSPEAPARSTAACKQHRRQSDRVTPSKEYCQCRAHELRVPLFVIHTQYSHYMSTAGVTGWPI